MMVNPRDTIHSMTLNRVRFMMSSTHEDLWAKKGMMDRMTMIYVKSICWFQECRSWWFQICFPISGHASPRGNGETLCRHWIMFQDTQLRDCQAMCSTFYSEALRNRKQNVLVRSWLKSGWWFGTSLFFHILGIITPTDFHIFQRGWNHPPGNGCYSCWGFCITLLLCFRLSKKSSTTYSSALIPDHSSLRRKVHKPLIINTSLNYRAWD